MRTFLKEFGDGGEFGVGRLFYQLDVPDPEFASVPKFLSLAIIVALTFAFAGRAAAQEQDPGIWRPVTPQEINRLKRQIDEDTRPSVEAIVNHRTEAGDLNNRLDFFQYGGRLNLKWGASSAFQLTGTRTNYIPGGDLFREQGTNFTAGIQTRLSEFVEARLEAGATRFSTGSGSVNALASLMFNAYEQTRLYVTASRNNVEESLLSTTGIRPVTGPFAGQLVGRVMENRIVLGGSSRLLGRFDIFGEGGAGNRAGSNVPSNFFKTIGGGAGYSIFARPDDEPLSMLRAAYELNYFGFAENRFGFGGASLVTRGGAPIDPARVGSDGNSPVPGSTRAGTGGYFSPENFVSSIVRVETGGSFESLSYKVSGFLGSQHYTGAAGRLANGLSATVSVVLTEQVSLPVTYLLDNFGPFRQQSLYARLAVRF